MDKSPQIYFIALLPPQTIQEEVTQIKQHFANHYKSSHALKSPPHITVQAPFKWLLEDLPDLEKCLREFAQQRLSVPIFTDGFGAFAPRVIYIEPLKTPELMALQQELSANLESSLGIVDPNSRDRPFTPHMTVAFKDLTRQAFKAAWPEFRDRSLRFQFTAANLTLLIHDDRQWNIHTEFPFGLGIRN